MEDVIKQWEKGNLNGGGVLMTVLTSQELILYERWLALLAAILYNEEEKE